MMAMLISHGLSLLLGFLLDLCFGDPRWLYHPICITGNLIAWLQKKLRAAFPKTQKGEHQAGLLLVILVCIYSLGAPAVILYALYRLHWAAGFAAETFWCYQLLAAKSLKTESMKVYAELEKEDLEGARYAVSMIVGRDTKSLTDTGVVKATVETIAENTSDGVAAPMIYMAIGGVPLMYLYKGINTMDSMVGYKDEKYLHFGRYAAKLDDLANFIPARICGILMILAAYLLGMNGKGAAQIFQRDRFNHASPNSAQTESVMAGALGVQLAGDAWYFGKLYKKPTIGDFNRPVEKEDIPRANRLMYGASALCCLVLLVILGSLARILL